MVFILLVDELDKAHAKDVGVKHGSCIQERVEANPPPPPNRVGKPEDVAGVVLYLGGPGSKFVA